MSQQFCPAVESLSERLLPSAMSIAPPPSPAAHASDAGSALQVEVETDRLRYGLWKPVLIRITETNTSDHEILAGVGGCGGPVADFGVWQSGIEWYRYSQDPYIIWPTCPVSYGEGVLLAPGESRTAEYTWTNRGALLGQLEIRGSFDGVAADPVTITIKAPPVAAWLEVGRKEYRLGQPVPISYGISNPTPREIGILGWCLGISGPTIYTKNGESVWTDPIRLVIDCAPQPKFLRPGEENRYTIIWEQNTLFGAPPVRPGRYTIEIALETMVLTTTFRIKAGKS